MRLPRKIIINILFRFLIAYSATTYFSYVRKRGLNRTTGSLSANINCPYFLPGNPIKPFYRSETALRKWSHYIQLIKLLAQERRIQIELEKEAGECELEGERTVRVN